MTSAISRCCHNLLQSAIANGGKILVHCMNGRNRCVRKQEDLDYYSIVVCIFFKYYNRRGHNLPNCYAWSPLLSHQWPICLTPCTPRHAGLLLVSHLHLLRAFSILPFTSPPASPPPPPYLLQIGHCAELMVDPVPWDGQRRCYCTPEGSTVSCESQYALSAALERMDNAETQEIRASKVSTCFARS